MVQFTDNDRIRLLELVNSRRYQEALSLISRYNKNQAMLAVETEIKRQIELQSSDLYRRAFSFFSTGNFEQVLNLLDSGKDSFPPNIDFEKLRALALIKQNKLEEAELILSGLYHNNSNDLEVVNNLALVYKKRNKLLQAVSLLRTAAENFPENVDILLNLGNALRSQKKMVEAGQIFEKIIYLDPDHKMAKYNLAAMKGEGVASAPSEYIQALFDDYAHNFEHHLTGVLGYNSPEICARKLNDYYTLDDKCRVLDLGCGTGLLATFLRGDILLDGVDLSAGMLKIAESKNRYNHLEQADILTFLQKSVRKYNAVFSVDVFVYVGSLVEVFAAVKKALVKGGLFIFSIETFEGENFLLSEARRFKHSEGYIKQLLNERNFELLDQQGAVLRHQNNNDVAGTIFTARKL